MRDEKAEAEIRQRYETVRNTLNERSRRLFAASEATAYGRGGIVAVNRATGIARRTVEQGIKELKQIEKEGKEPEEIKGRIRHSGGGRKKAEDKDPTLIPDLKELVDSTTRGDPESPLLWTSRSLMNLVKSLKKMNHNVGKNIVARLLKKMGYSLQGNRKKLEGAQHPDRDAQFQNIDERVRRQIENNEPAISVDAKKKENVGNYKNAGRELRPEGQPEDVNVYDFIDKDLGKAVPYGVYDISENEAWVSVGINHETAEFSVQTIRTWWYELGQYRYPNTKSILIIADGGGSNGYRLRLWKVELQKLANELGIMISVCHMPPGTSKWNKIEHRLFSFITKNWRGKPLVTHQVIVNLISATTTSTGLEVRCKLDEGIYPIGRRVSDREMENVNLIPDKFHGEWNYSIAPLDETDND